MHNTKNDLSKTKREKVTQILNQSLADSVDLKTQAKQAHWNVKGPGFIALHELFDQIAGEMDKHVDEIAERVTSLGGTAMGTARIAAEKSSLSEYPHEITDGASHIDALSSAMADYVKKIRKNIDITDELGDAVTADLYTGVASNIDKLLWFVEAHIQD